VLLAKVLENSLEALDRVGAVANAPRAPAPRKLAIPSKVKQPKAKVKQPKAKTKAEKKVLSVGKHDLRATNNRLIQRDRQAQDGIASGSFGPPSQHCGLSLAPTSRIGTWQSWD
jgi:hypothetical protein